MSDPPSQSHSDTSTGAARKLSRERLIKQEQWIYETLRQRYWGKADWELWDMVRFEKIFDQKSSCRRARIGLYWRSRALGATPWHPVEDSGKKNRDPYSGMPTVIWRLKERYKDVPYEQWARDYRNLAKGVSETVDV